MTNSIRYLSFFVAVLLSLKSVFALETSCLDAVAPTFPNITSVVWQNAPSGVVIGVNIGTKLAFRPTRLKVMITRERWLNLPQEFNPENSKSFYSIEFKTADLTVDPNGNLSLPVISIDQNKYRIRVKSIGCLASPDEDRGWASNTVASGTDISSGTLIPESITAERFDVSANAGFGLPHYLSVKIPSKLINNVGPIYWKFKGVEYSTTNSVSLVDGLSQIASGTPVLIAAKGDLYFLSWSSDQPESISFYTKVIGLFEKSLYVASAEKRTAEGLEICAQYFDLKYLASKISGTQEQRLIQILTLLLNEGESIDGGVDLMLFAKSTNYRIESLNNFDALLKTYASGIIENGIQVQVGLTKKLVSYLDAYTEIPISIISRNGLAISSASLLEGVPVVAALNWKGAVAMYFKEANSHSKITTGLVCSEYEPGKALDERICDVSKLSLSDLAEKGLWAKVDITETCKKTHDNCPATSTYSLNLKIGNGAVVQYDKIQGQVSMTPVLQKMEKSYSISGSVEEPIVNTRDVLNSEYGDIGITPGEKLNYSLNTDFSGKTIASAVCVGPACVSASKLIGLKIENAGSYVEVAVGSGDGVPELNSDNQFRISADGGDGGKIVIEKQIKVFTGYHLVMNGYSKRRDDITTKEANNDARKYVENLHGQGINARQVSALASRYQKWSDQTITIKGASKPFKFKGLLQSDLVAAAIGTIANFTYLGHSVSVSEPYDPEVGADPGAPIIGGYYLNKADALPVGFSIVPRSKPATLALNFSPMAVFVNLGCNSAVDKTNPDGSIDVENWAKIFTDEWKVSAAGTLGYSVYIPSKLALDLPVIPGILTTTSDVIDEPKKTDIKWSIRIIDGLPIFYSLKKIGFPRMSIYKIDAVGGISSETYVPAPFLQPRIL